MYSIDELLGDNHRLLLILSTLFCVFAASAYFFSQKRIKSLDEQAAQERHERSKTREQRGVHPLGRTENANNAKKKDPFAASEDVWEERRKKGISSSSSSLLSAASSSLVQTKGDKPFHSSYYYAHNSTNSKGGYSDGLRMEDYTMNGPRLLSKGGKSVVESNSSDGDDQEIKPKEETTGEAESRTTNNQQSSSTGPRTKFLVITKYLWDDPGDSSGVASIWIDSLPSPSSSTEVVPWKDASANEASAMLINDSKGLLVVVRSSCSDVEYRLEIKQLYGDVTSAKAIIKPKRLIVKLQKKKGGWLSGNKANLAAWPRPHKKVT